MKKMKGLTFGRLESRKVFAFVLVVVLVFVSVLATEEQQTETGKRALRKIDKNVRRRLEYQPSVQIVEGQPGAMGFNSISNVEGTPWCGGAPTYWITGHQSRDAPYCLVDGTWVLNKKAAMDASDEMNSMDGTGGIDRHACVTMDVNKDGLDDIICSVGARLGKGEGFNELYITQENGKLEKIQRDHGLQKYPSMRNRLVVVLKDRRQKKKFVFFGTIGGQREDGLPNEHRMFRNIYKEDGQLPYFEEVLGPWVNTIFEASCAISGDFTGDGLDDLVICNEKGKPMLIEQSRNDTFVEVMLPNNRHLKNWRGVRIVDITRDGLVDLVAVTFGQPSTLYIFRGIEEPPHFDFLNPLFRTELEWASPDLEILDVNDDNALDIYVVQADETKNEYCGAGNGNRWWNLTHFPPPSFVPPVDVANDVLLIGTPGQEGIYSQVKLEHALPGCGWIAQRWDNKTMLLGQGNWDSAGYGLLLKW